MYRRPAARSTAKLIQQALNHAGIGAEHLGREDLIRTLGAGLAVQRAIDAIGHRLEGTRQEAVAGGNSQPVASRRISFGRIWAIRALPSYLRCAGDQAPGFRRASETAPASGRPRSSMRSPTATRSAARSCRHAGPSSRPRSGSASCVSCSSRGCGPSTGRPRPAARGRGRARGTDRHLDRDRRRHRAASRCCTVCTGCSPDLAGTAPLLLRRRRRAVARRAVA